MESTSPQGKDLRTLLKFLDKRHSGEGLGVDARAKAFDLADRVVAGGDDGGEETRSFFDHCGSDSPPLAVMA